ncbi:MAG: 4-hydroxy-tetrahydrodipicolinate reductase [Flavobacteriales bacterium]
MSLYFKQMDIALIGYGRMGREVESAAAGFGHSIVLKADVQQMALSAEDLQKADVVIEFTEPASAVDNIYKCFDANVPVVVGTTGWYDRLADVKQRCLETDQCLLYASNFSIGMNLFFSINAALAKRMDKWAEYDVDVNETHHIHKLDAPSGTAITLAEQILYGLKRKKSWVKGRSDKSDELEVHSKREGEVPGTHIVRYDSDVDDITIRHEAKSRKGFALGAVRAAEWVQGKKGFFTMADMLGLDH